MNAKRELTGNVDCLGHDFNRISVYAPASAMVGALKEIPNRPDFMSCAGQGDSPSYVEVKAHQSASTGSSLEFAHTPDKASSNIAQAPVYPWSAGGVIARERPYGGRPCQSQPVATGPGIQGVPVTAFTETFNILWSNASVNGNFRSPNIVRPYMINQHGPSFSMVGRVEAPQSATGYRLGVIQQVLGGQTQAHYNNLTTGAPLGYREWTCGSGLDVDVGSTPPWYDSDRTLPMAPIALSGLSDDPGMDNLRLVVNNQGVMRGTPAGKLARYSGCQRFRVWLVIEAPSGAHQAIAWAQWAANYNIAYNTLFTSVSAGPPTTTATSTVSTGWMTSPLQIGAGPPIPATRAPACVGIWR